MVNDEDICVDYSLTSLSVQLYRIRLVAACYVNHQATHSIYVSNEEMSRITLVVIFLITDLFRHRAFTVLEYAFNFTFR